MITGIVEDLKPCIRLRVRGPKGRERQVKALVDSGYNGLLALPRHLVTELGLPWQSAIDVTLADGSKALFPAYEAVVVWDRRVRRIIVVEAGTEPLVGMALLRGYELTMQVKNRGKVRIVRLS